MQLYAAIDLHSNHSFVVVIDPEDRVFAKRLRSARHSGVRVIHFNRVADGTVWLMTMYAENVGEDVDVKALVKIRETLDGKAQRKGTGKVRGQPKSR